MKCEQEKIEIFFKKLDRQIFMENYLEHAYKDRPFSIGYGQTISQPSLVLEMTLLLELTPESKVLEIGTGSGYQTAFLAEFSKEVYTIKLIKALYDTCVKRYKNLTYKNIHFIYGDGSVGLKEQEPYDRIIVIAASPGSPKKLLDQLANNGIMVVPIGSGVVQELCVFRKNSHGTVEKEFIEYVQFVPLVFDH